MVVRKTDKASNPKPSAVQAACASVSEDGKDQRKSAAGKKARLAMNNREQSLVVEITDWTQQADLAMQHLPVWPDSMRGMPNVLLRSGLFSTLLSRECQVLVDEHEVPNIDNGYEIRLTGYLLNQSDKTLWLAILHLARERGLNFSFSGNEMLALCGRSDGAKNHAWLVRTLNRLHKASVRVICKETGDEVRFHLIGDGMSLASAGSLHYMVMSPALLKLFGWKEWTKVLFAERQQIQGERETKSSALALWLHTFYTSHTEPLEYKVETVRRLVGRMDMTIRSFMTLLTDACLLLAVSTGWSCSVTPTGKLKVSKKREQLQEPQRRHLARKAASRTAETGAE